MKRGATPLCSALLCDTHSAHPNIPAAKCGAQYNCRLAELQMRTDQQRGLAELYHGNSRLELLFKSLSNSGRIFVCFYSFTTFYCIKGIVHQETQIC